MSEPRPENEPQPEDETRPIPRPEPAGEHTEPISPASGPTPAGDHTAPMDPFQDDEDDLRPTSGDQTAIQDSTRVIPPPESTPAWAGRAGVPVPPPADRLRDAAPYDTGQPSQPRTWWTPVLLGLLALGLLGVVVLVAWWMNRDDTPEPAVTSTTAPTLAPTPSLVPTTAAPTPSPTPTVQLVQVPVNLVGMTQDAAVKELNRLGLGYSFEFQDSTRPEDEVIATRPAGQELVPVGSTVTLVISKGGVASPTPSPSPSPTASAAP